ncbi:MAG: AAA family ATPase [Anaerolineae bacterium]|nr:AAA family ATPase [Anaerolineae bacterium]
MTLLFLDNLPPQINKGAILRFIIEIGGANRDAIGRIELAGRQATVDVPDTLSGSLVKALDGAQLNHRHIRAWTQAQAGRPSARADEDHFQRLARLLDLEAEAEKAQLLADMQRAGSDETAERTGQTLIQLVIIDEYGGLGGRILVTLAKRSQNQPLPWHRLEVGTPIILTEESSGGDAAWRGVVSQRDRQTIQVALNAWPETETSRPTFRLDVSTDEIARQRQRDALARARSARSDRTAELRRVLLFEQPPSFQKQPDAALTPLDNDLNPPQLEAVRFALAADDVAIIHGPPGTGKTTTVVEVIRQAVQQGQTVLACAPSNLAVDNVFERLLAAGESVLRLGHPARVLPQLREHTLDLLVDNHPDMKIARNLVREAHALREQAGKFRRARPEPGAKREMRQEAKQMLADARRIEAQTVERILDSARILCATTTGLSSEVLGQRRFDLGVIDEAGQSTEPGVWLPILRSDRIILAGDHCQLPPTVVSPDAAAQGFGLSLMERLMTELGPTVSRQLTVQYRMNEAIMNFSSQEFYDDSLQADPSVQGHLLSDLPGVTAEALTDTPVEYIDTAGASYDEEIEPDGQSRRNSQEAVLVSRKVEALLATGVLPGDIAVITPYAAQVRLLRELLEPLGVEADTVDGFQGREKEAVIISLVRSNQTGDIGFLADTRRMNVALTRARRKLLVIGDSATISVHPFYERLIGYFEQIGAYRSVWEEAF